MGGPAKPLSLRDVIRWTMGTLVGMAQRREWGEIRITVQGGQIMLVHQGLSFRDRLPQQDAAAQANLEQHVPV